MATQLRQALPKPGPVVPMLVFPEWTAPPPTADQRIERLKHVTRVRAWRLLHPNKPREHVADLAFETEPLTDDGAPRYGANPVLIEEED